MIEMSYNIGRKQVYIYTFNTNYKKHFIRECEGIDQRNKKYQA